MNEQMPINPEWDPEKEIRSDLWPTMNVSQLSRQQELVIDRLNKLQSIMGSVGTPSISNIYGALTQAMKDLSYLIDHRSQQKPKKNT